MADFTFYDEPPEYLNATDLIKIYDNLFLIRFLLNNQEHEVPPLKIFAAKTDTPPSEVRDKINSIEQNIDIINDVFPSGFYGGLVRFEGTAPRKDDVWRWIKIVNDWYTRLADTETIDVLKCTDGYPTIDGKYISIKTDS